MTGWSLAARGVWGYRLAFLGVLAFSFLVALGSMTLAEVRSAIGAAANSATLSRVPEGYAMIDARDGHDQSILEGLPHAIAVADFEADISAGDVAASVSVRATREPFPPLGAVVEGTSPRVPGSVALSAADADALAVSVGDRVRIDGQDLTVSGLLIDPSDREAHLASAVESGLVTEPALWAVPEADLNSLADSLSDQATIRTAETALLLAQDNYHDRPGPSRASALICAGLGSVLLGILLALVYRATRDDRRALAQAGMTRVGIHALAGGIACGVTSAGSALGVLAAVVLVRVLRDPLAQTWGQAWLQTPAPASWAIGLILSPAVIGCLVAALLSSERLRERTPHRRVGGVLVAAACVFVTWFAFSVWTRYGFRDSAPILGLLILNAAIALLGLAVHRRRRSAYGLFVTHAATGTLTLSLALASVVYFASFQSGWAWHVDRKYDERSVGAITQAPGSLVISEIPESAVQVVENMYTDLGGGNALYAADIATSGLLAEVVAPSLGRCIREDPTIDWAAPPLRCIEGTVSYGTIYSLGVTSAQRDAPGAPDAFAAPEMIEDGAIAVVFSDPDQPKRNPQVVTIPVQAQPGLGNFMPGATLPGDHPVLRKFGLRPTPTGSLYLPDFGSFKAPAQARLRGLLLQVAPGSLPTQTGHAPNGSDQGARLWGLGATAGIVILLSAFLTSFIASLLPLRRTARRLGARRSQRWRISLAVFALPVTSVLAGFLQARVVLEYLGWGVAAGYGWASLVPPIGTALTLAGGAWILARRPAFRAE